MQKTYLKAVVSVLLFVLPTIARADATYTYTGQNFTLAIGTFTTSNFITGSMTFASPLAANLAFGPVTPTAFSFYDGVDTITDQNAIGTGFLLTTDASGNIDNWQILVIKSNDPINIAMTCYPSLHAAGDAVISGGANQGVNDVCGVWQSPVGAPEPSSLLLLGTGFIGAAGVIRRRVIR